MDPVEREFGYERQNGTPRLTPAQGRRARHKTNSPKTHSHSGLLLAAGEDGRVRRLPCPRCCMPPRQKPRVGGAQ
jgi:hypothetical protein